jgi:glutamine amidotransferase
MVVITPKMNLLQIPIIDEYYVAPSDPAAPNRGTDFAAGKGLLSPRRDLPRLEPDTRGLLSAI